MPPYTELPRKQSDQVADLRDALMKRSRDALVHLQPSIQADAEKAIDRIVQSGYDMHVVRRETSKLTRGYFRELRRELARAIEDAADLLGRYNEDLLKWEIEKRRKLLAEGAPIAPSRALFGIKHGEAMATAALLGSIADVPKRTFVPKTEGDEIIKRELVPWRKRRKLSTRLHSAQINAERDAIRFTSRAIREGKALQANNDLILDLAKRGHTVGGAKKLPGYLTKFEQAGNKLMALQKPSPRDKAATREYEKALAEWRRQRAAVRRYADRLAEGGRVQNALIEVLQRTSDSNAKRMSSALDVFLNQKQSYNAERILDTEIHTSFRSAQAQRDITKPYIVAYIWRLQRDARRDFVKRTKPTRMKLSSGRRTVKARRCVCEMLDGRRISKEAALMYPQGGHPFCRCFLEPVYSSKLMAQSPITAEEDRWYEREFGD
jgi:hypothetical protein